jgi:hypothetical protein
MSGFGLFTEQESLVSGVNDSYYLSKCNNK